MSQKEKNKDNNIDKTTTELDGTKVQQGITWLESNKNSVPAEIYPILKAGMFISEKFIALSISNKLIRGLLGKLFNSVSRSEKKSSDGKTKNDKSADEKNERGRQRNERNENEKYNEKSGNSKDKNKPSGTEQNKKDEIKQEENFSDEALYDPVISSKNILGVTNQKDVHKEEEFGPMHPKNLRSEYNERVVTNIKFVVEHITLRVETVTDMISGKRVTAKVDEAPAYCSYTYETIMTLIQQHVVYFIPFHRMAIMYKNALNISRSTIYRFHYYVAQVFLFIYLELFKELINKAEVIQIDDTKTKILNEKQEDEFDNVQDFVNDKEEEKKFKGLIDPKIKICQTLHDEIGMLSYRKDNKKVKKVNVTCLTGKIDKVDKKSRISIFYTHFGQAGDLLEKLLLHRKKKEGGSPLYIVSDLATFNQADIATIKKHNVITSGCNAHARRNFWNARKLDDNIYFMLRCYKFLYHIEKIIANKTEADILRYRQRYSKITWKILIHGCKKRIFPKWPDGSAPKKAVDYLLNHEKELSLYMDNPKLPIDNNRSERGIRGEKLMLAGCKFRYNSEGRAVFDILRTIITNCRNAQVNWMVYSIDVLRNREKVFLKPEVWTPLAWKKRQNI